MQELDYDRLVQVFGLMANNIGIGETKMLYELRPEIPHLLEIQ